MGSVKRKRSARRQVWLRIHRWLALGLGLFLALEGVTGAALVFKESWLGAEVGDSMLTFVESPGATTTPASPDRLKAAALGAFPELEGALGTAPPGRGFLPSENVIVFGPLRDRPGMGVAMVDPYSAQPRGFFVYDDLWLSKVVSLHTAMMLPPPAGRLLAASLGVVMMLSLVSGVWLWWPRGKRPDRWRRALLPGWQCFGLKPYARRWRDIHNLSAVALWLPMTLLAVTGVWLCVPMMFASEEAMRSLKPVFSEIHASLMLGAVGQTLVVLAGVFLVVLYATGLAVWWQKKTRNRSSNS